MKNLEGARVNIVEHMNPHYLVLGKPGAGKTYWSMKNIEKSIEEGKRICVLDFSGSYSIAEVSKSNPALLKKIEFVGTKESGGINWKNIYPTNDLLCDDVTDSVIKILGINSYYQKKLLREAVEMQLMGFPNFSFPMLVFTLEIMLGLVEEKKIVTESMKKMVAIIKSKERTEDDMKNIERLLARLAPYKHIYNFGIKKEVKEEEKLITVIQLNEMALQKKKFLTSFILEMLWNELKFDQEKRHCDVLVLDEFQFLPFSEDAALTNLLREARRFGLKIILISQFVSNYSRAEISALMQVGQKLFFRPAESELEFTASLVATKHKKEWVY